VNLEHLREFLVELSYNNSKPWFDKNRTRYQSLRLEFIDYVGQAIKEVSSFDASVKNVEAKSCLFRINRDVRFSHNKNPYKTHFSAAICSGGRHSSEPIYYLHVSGEGESVAAGGIWLPEASQLAEIRTFIAANQKRADKLLFDPTLLKIFGGLDIEHKLSRFPKNFPEGSDLLKLKSFTVSKNYDAFEHDSNSLLKEFVSSFKKMQPLIQFLRETRV
jgi:uncharacterized protein (TIGR02453 family)